MARKPRGYFGAISQKLRIARLRERRRGSDRPLGFAAASEDSRLPRFAAPAALFFSLVFV
jgi:hypothetical protein